MIFKFLAKNFILKFLVLLLVLTLLVLTYSRSSREANKSLRLEELTWKEIQETEHQGFTNIIIPTAGIEQNGMHMPLNKHELVVRYTSNEIAKRVGKTLIAPVINLTPEGSIEAKSGHMFFPGTISISEDVFAGLLEDTARSLLAHGFKNIFFIGDSYDNQEAQKLIAKKLQAEGLKVFHIDSYYANKDQEKLLMQKGFSIEQIGGHAGLRDSSEFIFVMPERVRKQYLQENFLNNYQNIGSYGSSNLANRSLGQELLEIKINNSIREIRLFLNNSN